MSQHPTDLEEAIFRTVGFFSLLNYPLTVFEVWKWLLEPATSYPLSRVVTVLHESEWLRARLVVTDGHVVFLGSESLIETKHARRIDAEKKWKRVRWIARYLSFVPSLTGAAIGNNLAWANTRPGSDIDFFVITRPRRVWLTRLLVVTPFMFLGLRPGKHVKHPVDFSFFTARHHTAFKSLRIHKRDIYFAQWILSLVPVVGEKEILRVVEQNPWVSRLFPNAFGVSVGQNRCVRAPRWSMAMPVWFESASRAIQKKRFPEEIRDRANTDTCVVVTDSVLKFHINDRREQFVRQLDLLCKNT